MCGILFLYNPNDNNNEFSKRLNRLIPRGPDEYRIIAGDNYIAGHTRNCITNPMGGKQPIEKNQWIIIHNGEIYNGMDNEESDSYHILQTIQEYGPEAEYYLYTTFTNIFPQQIHWNRGSNCSNIIGFNGIYYTSQCL